MSNTTPSQILFIDSRVPDADVLLAGLDPSIEIVRLNSTESGLQQMARAVEGRSDIASVHVISHGGPGVLALGSSLVNEENLVVEQEALAAFKSALTEDADLLLYGCDVAAGDEGQRFINALAAATGADVAASIDLTGGATPESDWDLESSTGFIETQAIEPTNYQHDLGWWRSVYLTSGDRYAINKGQSYTVRFDADGGGKKGGVDNYSSAYNVSGLYASGYDHGGEIIDFSFRGSSSAVPGSAWYVSNYDREAGSFTYWGAYANSTPWQLTSSVTINQGQSTTLFVGDLVRDDFYTSSSDIWKYLIGASTTGYVSSSNLTIGNSSTKFANFYAPNVTSWKGTVHLGSITYTVHDGINYSAGGVNPDFYSVHSRYKAATYTTQVYGTYADDAIVWSSAPADQNWNNQVRNTVSYGRGAVEPDSSDFVTGYHLINITDITGGGSVNLGTTLPGWITASGTNGNTLSVKNLAPEFANKIFNLTVEARSSADIAGTADDYLTKVQKQFKITTGTVAQLNDLPTSPGNALTVREDRAIILSATDFNFVDLDNTVGGSSATGARLENVRITSVPANGALKLFATAASGPTVAVTTQGASGVKEVLTAIFTDVTTETVIQLGTTVAKVAAGATATQVAQAVVYELNNDKFSLFTATANSGTVTLTAKASGVMTDLTSASFKILDNPGAALANDVVLTAAQLTNLVFIPTADFSGDTSFSYKVNDGYADALTASTMKLTVSAVNDLPVFTPTTPLTATVLDLATPGVAIAAVNGVLTAADPEGTTVLYGIDAEVPNYSGTATYTAPVVTVVTAGAGATSEVTEVSFAPATQATTVLFNKTTIQIGASDTAALVATKVANAITANAAEEFTAIASGAVVTLTAKVAGERADLTAADFGYQTVSRTGQYGVLTVDQVSGKWVYTPTQTVAINQLKGNETATEIFGLTAIDAAGQAAGKALTITIDGENSSPVLANALVGSTFNASRQYTLPADSFKDIDGDTLTWSATIGGVAVPSTNASGISFDPATRTFTAAGSSVVTPATVVVSVTDSVTGSTVATDTFIIGNTAPVTAKPIPYKIIKTSSEVTTVTFADKPVGATTITFDGEPIDISGASTAQAVATAMAGGTYTHFTVTASGADITVTATAAGNSTDITASDFAYTGASATVSVTQPVKEKTEFSFALTESTGSTITFKGDIYTLVGGAASDAATLATRIVQTLNGDARFSGSYTATNGTSGNLFIESKTGGSQTDLLSSDLAIGANNTTSVVSTIQGVNETSTFTFADNVSGSKSITFDGSASIGIADGATGIAIADAIATELGASTANYTVSYVTGTDQISVVAKTAGDKTDLTASAFSTTFTSATATVATITPGGAWSYTIPADTFTDANGDPLTLSVYGPYQSTAPSLTTTPAATGTDHDVTVVDFTSATVPSKIRFEKQIVNIATATPEGVVSALVASINANTSSLYTAAVDADPKKLVLTTKALGDAVADPALADFATLLTASTPIAYTSGSSTISGSGDQPASKFTVVASDGSASSANTFTLQTYSTTPPTLPSSVDIDFSGAGNFSYTIPSEAFHLSTAQTFTKSGTWPAWANIVSGKIVGNPSASDQGSHALVVQGTSGQVTFNVNVSDANDPLVLSSAIATQTIGQGVTTFSQSVSGVFTDADFGSTITYQAYADKNRDGDYEDAGEQLASTGAYWLKFNGTTFTGTPDEALSSVNVKLVATSSDGSADSTTFQINLPTNAAGSFSAITVSGGNATAGTLTDNNTFTAGNVQYKWQTSTDAGTTWVDIASDGTRTVNAASLALLPSEVGTQLRVNAYYTDNNGFSETVTSAASALIDHTDVANQPGELSLVGDLKPGYTLFANVTDPNGLATVPTYVWYRSDSDTSFTEVIAGVNGNSYTLTSADSYKYIKVIASYQDKTSGNTLNVSAISNNLATASATDYVDLDATAPVAVNDGVAITENSGLLNATVASGSAAPKTGNLFTNDTDANAKEKNGTDIAAKRALFELADLRTGSIEGDGVQGRKIGTDVAYTFKLKGQFGWLEVTNSGAYSYYLDQSNESVQALTAASAALTDIFNYEINDGDAPELLSDLGTFTITISGANDLPTITGGIGRSSNAPAESSAADTTAPTLISSMVNGSLLVAKFTEGLAPTNLPSASSFVVTVAGTPVAVNSVAVNGAALSLTLATPVTQGQVVTVSYTDATSGNDTIALQDNNGNDVASIVSAVVTNKTPPAGDDVAPATFTAVVNGTQLQLTYNELLDGANLPHEADFTIVVGGTTLSWRDYRVVGAEEDVLTIQLNTPVAHGAAVTIAYQDWSAGNDVNAIQDLAGNDAASFIATAVTNTTTSTAAETFSATVNEDVASFLTTGGLVFTDFDSSNLTVKVVANNGARLVVPSSLSGVTVWGSDTSALILSGTVSAINSALSGQSIQYISAPNGASTGNTITVSASDDGGANYGAGVTSSVVISTKNDSPILDLDSSEPGYGFVNLFRPRGEAVPIAKLNATTIADADGTLLTGATIRIATGAVDNEFGTINETLTSSLNAASTFVWEGLTVSGNGTPAIEVTGDGTHANYRALINSINYLNANPNAYGGDRQITIRLTDKYSVADEQLESNNALLILATPNAAVRVGQKILIGSPNEAGTIVYTDSLATVAQVINSSSFVASNNLPLLTPTSSIRFVSTGSIESSVANTSLTLGSVNASIAADQKIFNSARTHIATVDSVSGAVVSANDTFSVLSAGSTVTFETDAVLTDIKTSAVRDVVSITTAGSSSTIVLNAIDLTIEPGQLIYEGSNLRGRVASVEFSGASGGTTTVTTAAAVSDVIVGDDLVFKTFATNLTPTATATIRNVWTTEVDLSGVLTAGRDHTVSFTEGQATGTPIAASSASLDNQAVFIKSIVVTLSNPTDKVSSSDAAATAEKLILDPAYVTPLLGRGITFARTSNDHVLTLSAINQSVGVTASDMQLALRAVQYTNSSDNPSVTPRLIDVTVTDTTNETGIPARTTIGIVPVNDAPTLGGDFAATVLEGGAYTLTTGDLLPADIDNDPLTLRYEVASTPSTITVFRDINGDGQVDSGEVLVPRVSSIVNGLEVTTTPGQEFTHAEVVGGIIKIRQDGSDLSITGFTEAQAEDLVNNVVYNNAAPTPSAGLRQVIFQNSTQMSSLGSASAAFGQQEIALQAGTTTVDGVTYTVVMSGSGATSLATLTVSKAEGGFTEAQAEAIVASLRYVNTASTPTAGNPTVSLSGVVTLTGVTEDTPIVVSTVNSEISSSAEAAVFDASNVTAANTAIPSGKNVSKLEFKVTNVAPADSEFLKLIGSEAQANITGAASDLFSGVDLATPTSGNSYKSLAFKVTGVRDGVNETITFNTGTVAAPVLQTIPLVVGSVVRDGTIFAVTQGANATEFLVNVSKPFAGIGLALRDNGENGVLPVNAALDITVTPVNDAPTLAAVAVGGTFTEGGSATALFSNLQVTDGDTSGAEQDIDQLTLTISGVRDGAAEELVVSGQSIGLVSAAVADGNPATLDYSVTVTGGTATVTLTKTDTAANWATLIQGLAYQNTSNAPTDGNRVVTLTSLRDTGGTPNGGVNTRVVSSSSTVNVVGVDTAPVLTNNAATVSNGGLLVLKTASPVMLTATDVDSVDDALVYTVTTAPTKGTLFLDRNANNDVDTGEALTASSIFTQTELAAGSVKYFHTGSVGSDGFAFTLQDATTTSSLNTFSITISASGGVTGSGTSTANSTDGTDPLFQQVAITTNAGESVQTLTFKVSGVKDGSSEYLTVNGRDVFLTAGETTVGGVTYKVVNDGSGNYTVTVTSAAGFDSTAANAIVNGATYGNDAVPPSSGERLISLSSVTTIIGTSITTTATNIGAITTVAPTVDVFTLDQAQAAIAAPGANNDIKALTFTVTGVKDGASEVIKVNGQEIPLVAGAPVVIDGVTYQVMASTPAGTFIVTMTDTSAPGLTEAQAEAIVAAVTLSNSDSTPTDGARSVSLSSYSVGLATGTAIASTPTTTLTSSTSSTTAVNGAAVEPLSGAVLTSTANVDVLTFSVSGVKDGSNEVLVIGGFSVPLVDGAVLSNTAGSYAVTVTNGVATVVFTPATPLTTANAQILVRGVDYLNNASPLTEGQRTVSLVSLSDVNSTTPIVQSATGSVSVALGEPTPKFAPLFNPTEVNAAILAPSEGNDYKSISFNLTGIEDGANEIFKVNGQSIPLILGTMTVNGVTYTVTGSGTSYTVTVTDTVLPGFTETDLQNLVNGVVLINTDSTPTEGVRGVTLGALEQGPAQLSSVTLGGAVPAATVVAPNTPVNALVGDTVTVPSGSTVDSLTFTVTGVSDGTAEVLKFGTTTVPLVTGTVTSTSPAGTYSVTVSEGIATVVFIPNDNLDAAETNALIAGVTYTNTDTTPTEGVRSLSLTGMAVDNGTTVTQTSVSTVTGQIPVKASTSPLFDSSAVATAIPALTEGSDFKSVSFNLTGIADGAAEVFRVNGQDIPLVAGALTVGGVTYTVTGTGPTYTVTVSDTIQPGFTEAALQTLVAGATLTNTASSPSEGARGVTLGTVTQGLTGTSTVDLASSVSVNVLAPDTPVRAMQGDTVVLDDATTSVDSMTFTVTGVKDGAAEVLTFGSTTIPLVDDTEIISTDPEGSFFVTVNDAGTATVVFRPAVNLTEGETNTLISAATYTNTSSTPTGGVRSLQLISMDIQTTDGGALTETPVAGVGGVIPVQGVIESESIFNNSVMVPSLIGGKTIDSLTFGVTGVIDGSNEVLVINGVTVPLINSTDPIYDGSGGSYSVVVTNGNAVVVYTPASNLTEAQANALLGGITYDNTSNNASDGARGFSVISMTTEDSNGFTTTATPGLNSLLSYGQVDNTAPVVSVNAGATVLENQTVTLSAAILAATDAEQVNLDLVFSLTAQTTQGRLFRDSNGNGLVNTGELISLGDTFTQGELFAGMIKYRHDGAESPRSDSLMFTVSDGEVTTPAQPFVFSVTPVNDMPSGRPTITSSVGRIEQHAVLTASLASFSDGDGLPGAGSIQYTWRADGAQIGTNASTYTLTAAEIDKKITVTIGYTDLGGTNESVISLATTPVLNVNDAPTLPAASLTVFEGGTITLNTSQLVAADQDGLELSHQFKLTSPPTQGQIYIDLNGNGSLDEGTETALGVDATFSQDDLFSGRVRYQHLGSEFNDSFALTVTDSGNLSSEPATFTVNRTAVNDAPVLQHLDGDVISVPTAGLPVLLDNVTDPRLPALVTDVDSTNFDGGQLRVAVNFNRNPAMDSLAIKQMGTGTDQISTTGSNVLFGATTIGTWAGGSGANDLVISLNSSANATNVAALIRAITFQNNETIPTQSGRTVSFTLTDGDGGTSAAARVTVNLQANGAPTFLNTNTTVAVFENSTQVGVFSATDPLSLATTYAISARTDASNVDRSKFTINATTGVLSFVSAPDFEVPTDDGADNLYKVVVRATNANGYAELPVDVAILDQTTGAGETPVDRTPPVYVMGTLNGTALTLFFSEATTLNSANGPAANAFAVAVGGTPVTVSSVSVNATAKTVTLTLASALSTATGLTVAYTDPSSANDTAAIQDIAGNDAASFTANSFINMAPAPSSGGGGGGGSASIGGSVGATRPTAPVVNPVMEASAPPLSSANPVAGDGNGDGIADSLQNAVVSMPLMMTSRPESATEDTPTTFITLVAASINGKVGASEVAQITQIAQKDAPDDLPAGVEMPMGLIAFTSTVATPGASSNFSLYVDASMSFNGYWKQNQDGIWTNLASAAFGGSITQEGDKLRIDFTIVDGGEFDLDGLADGVITDPGAVGSVPLSIMGMYAERPEGEAWF